MPGLAWLLVAFILLVIVVSSALDSHRKRNYQRQMWLNKWRRVWTSYPRPRRRS